MSRNGKRWNLKKLLTLSPKRRKSTADVKIVTTFSSSEEEGCKADSSAKWNKLESVLNRRMSRSELLHQKLRDEIATSKSTDADTSHSSDNTTGGYWSEPIPSRHHHRTGSDEVFGLSDEGQTSEDLSQQISSSASETLPGFEDEETYRSGGDDSSVGSLGQLVQQLTCGALLQELASDCCAMDEGERSVRRNSITARDICRRVS